MSTLKTEKYENQLLIINQEMMKLTARFLELTALKIEIENRINLVRVK